MKSKLMLAATLALFLSVGAYAQTTPAKPRHSPEERAARRAEKKARLAQMTPAERKAFKQTHRQQREARLNAMTPEKRARVMARREHRRAMKVGKS